MKPLLIVAGVCALLCGCIGVKQEEYYWAHFGTYPTNYHEVIGSWVEKNFDSPRSVYITTPARCRFPQRVLKDDPKVYGWHSGVSFESKDAFDQYTPRKHYQVYLRDGQIVTTTYNTQVQGRMRGIAQPPRIESSGAREDNASVNNRHLGTNIADFRGIDREDVPRKNH